jgi:hypothetical protein
MHPLTTGAWRTLKTLALLVPVFALAQASTPSAAPPPAAAQPSTTAPAASAAAPPALLFAVEIRTVPARP